MEKIIDRVKKLLALSNSSNEHEAQLAAQRAADLLSKHNMTLTDVEILDCEVIEEWFEVSKLGEKGKPYTSFPRWISRLSAVIARHFFCTPLLSKAIGKKKVGFIGSRSDAEVAKYVFYYLVKTTESLSAEHIKRSKTMVTPGRLRKYKLSYQMGVVNGIRLKLEESKKEPFRTASGTDLMVIKDEASERYLQQKYGSIKQGRKVVNTLDGHAYAEGIKDGRNIEIREGIAATETMEMPCLPY